MYFAAESSVCLGETLLMLKQPGPAQRELDAVLNQAERLGALVLRAKTIICSRAWLKAPATPLTRGDIPTACSDCSRRSDVRLEATTC